MTSPDEHLFLLEVIHHDGSQRRRTALEAVLNSKTVNVWLVSIAVEAERSPGVRQKGDPTHMRRIAGVLQANDSHPPSVLLEVPFVAAHLAHALLRRIGAATLAAIAQSEVKAKDEASRTLAEDLLTAWLTRQVQELTAGVTPPATLSEAEREASGVVELDQAAARLLQGTGKAGQAAWEKFSQRPRGKNPWVRWLRTTKGDPCSVSGLHALARVGWLDIVKPRLDEANRTHHRSVIRPVFASQIVTSHIRPNIRETPDGQRLLPGLVEGGLDCRIIPQTDPRLVKRIIAGLDKLGTLTGHRVLRWEIETGHRQFLDGLTRPGVDFRKIEVEGGYGAIAERIGLTSNQDVTAVREIIAAQDATIFNFPWAHMGAGHDGRLLIREEIGATRGRRARVNLILGTMLVPGYASAINNPSVSAASRKLVPVTDLPPLIGRPNEYGPQVSLSMMLVLYLRDRAIELYEQGMVRLRPVDLQRMAREVGLPDDTAFLSDLWRRWQGEEVKGSDPSTPPFVKVDGDRFTLSDHHATARQAIVDAGAQEAAGRTRGQASQELRAKKQAGTLKRGR